MTILKVKGRQAGAYSSFCDANLSVLSPGCSYGTCIGVVERQYQNRYD